tara:strand:- start:979 stop:1095 length:117 start_codon:yes stop_codon:yes gene_type:complete
MRSIFGRVPQQPEGDSELAAVTGLLRTLGTSQEIQEID